MKDEPVEIFHQFNKLKHSVIAQPLVAQLHQKLIFSSPFSNIFSLDRDVAELYGVTTKVVNQAIRNNPDKFPSGYVIELTNSEKEHVVKNFDHLETLKFSHATVKGFTEQGLYMLATILKSPMATEGKIQAAMNEVFADKLPLKMRKLTFGVNLGVLKFSIETTRESKE